MWAVLKSNGYVKKLFEDREEATQFQNNLGGIIYGISSLNELKYYMELENDHHNGVISDHEYSVGLRNLVS